MHTLTIVFDLDGTLVDTAPDLIAATHHALSGHGYDPVAPDRIRPWISFGARRMITEALVIAEGRHSEAEVDAMLERFLDYYEANIARESRPFPGALAALDACRAAGARLAVCTNKRERLSRALLDALDLSGRFIALAGRDTFSVSKPHPDHLIGAIGLAGGHREHTIMIGDSKVDIETARGAGVPVIACSFGYSETPVELLGPDAVIGHYDELQGAIRRLGSRLAATA